MPRTRQSRLTKASANVVLDAGLPPGNRASCRYESSCGIGGSWSGNRRFSEEQDTGILKEGEAGERVADICRRHGSHAHAHYRWKAKYGGMDLDEAVEGTPGRESPSRPDSHDPWPKVGDRSTHHAHLRTHQRRQYVGHDECRRTENGNRGSGGQVEVV
ncbi:MAG: transposase [SAR202 cluster bacterium]|nr:transposase [SAR202 cluster bacterium]